MKAAEGDATGAVEVAGRDDIGVSEGEVERGSSRARATRPVEAIVAGVGQGATRNDIPATDKEGFGVMARV